MCSEAPPRETILIVEDDRASREALVELLELEGYRVLSARDGAEALAQTEADSVDLILSDVRMPRVDGFDLVAKLRDRAAEAPVIFMSGFDDRRQRLAAFDAGGDDFLTKPLDPDELLAHLRAHLRRNRSHKQLAQVSVTDALTGVLNRRGLFNALERELSRASRSGGSLSVLMIDCNHFKAINDAYGHEVGDRALQRLAAALVDSVRTQDQVGRIGGDEFVIILPETGAIAANTLADRVHDACCVPLAVRNGCGEIQLSAAVGTATLRDGESIDHLLARADRAMYAAKRHGEEPFPAAC